MNPQHQGPDGPESEDFMDMEAMVEGYCECAAWANEPEEETWGTFSDEGRATAARVCREFVEMAGPLVQEYLTKQNARQMGHDLWLTSKGHGAGFWDRGMGELGGGGDKLTKIAHKFPMEIWADEDGRIHLE
jgi:hypothetical protein